MTIPLNHDSITNNLRTQLVGRHVVVYRNTASTNDLVWRYAADRTNDGIAVFAEEQTSGRGRGGHKWLSWDSKSLLCSILLLDTKISGDLLTLAAGVAVAEAIGRCGRDTASIKWPNDVMLGNRKVAGILIESKTLRNAAACVVGIGVNCCQSHGDFGPDLADSAISIEMATGTPCDRNTVAKRLLVALDEWFAVATEEPRKVTDAWLELCNQLNHRITLQYNNHRYAGTCVGVDPQQGLIVQLDSDGIRMFDAAHTHTVRLA
jgi:BirA family transcriptional regulator, biotin operon repressor / biotin---[acetyl-CoA-carboxylase] ligase